AAFHHVRASVLYAEGPEPVTLVVQAVSPLFEETLGVPPLIGRGFEDADARVGAEPVVLLSHGFWRTAYGGDRDVVGRVVELDGIRHRVIGVMPEGFKFPAYASTEVWIPLREDGTLFGRPRPYYSLVGRLRGEAPIEVAQARADA